MSKKYQRVTLKGDSYTGGFYDTPENIKLFLEDCDDPTEYVIRDSSITEEAVNNLPDFQGF